MKLLSALLAITAKVHHSSASNTSLL